MPRAWFIVTGAPGTGKTSTLRELSRRGHSTVAEAATDLIERAQAGWIDDPWVRSAFIDEILAEQLSRADRADCAEPVFFDRSPVCTVALARYGGIGVSAALASAAAAAGERYDRHVFCFADLGFVVPTPVRRITYADALRFGRIHVDIHREYGFELLDVPPGTVGERADHIESAVRTLGGC